MVKSIVHLEKDIDVTLIKERIEIHSIGIPVIVLKPAQLAFILQEYQDVFGPFQVQATGIWKGIEGSSEV